MKTNHRLLSVFDLRNTLQICTLWTEWRCYD